MPLPINRTEGRAGEPLEYVQFAVGEGDIAFVAQRKGDEWGVYRLSWQDKDAFTELEVRADKASAEERARALAEAAAQQA